MNDDVSLLFEHHLVEMVLSVLRRVLSQNKVYFGTCEKLIKVIINYFMTCLNESGVNVVDFVDWGSKLHPRLVVGNDVLIDIQFTMSSIVISSSLCHR